MASSPTPAEVLREMDEYVSVARSGHLELGYRLRLWSVMRTKFGREESWTRREALGLLVASNAASRWDAELVDPQCAYRDVLDGFPEKCLDLGRRFSRSEATLSEFEAVFDRVEELVDHVGFCVNDEMVAVFGTVASLKPCLLQTEGEYFIDRYQELVAGVAPGRVRDVTYEGHRDVHFWGSWVAAHFDREHRSQSARRRHYWLRWIHEMAPKVLGSKKKLASLLSE